MKNLDFYILLLLVIITNVLLGVNIINHKNEKNMIYNELRAINRNVLILSTESLTIKRLNELDIEANKDEAENIKDSLILEGRD